MGGDNASGHAAAGGATDHMSYICRHRCDRLGIGGPASGVGQFLVVDDSYHAGTPAGTVTATSGSLSHNMGLQVGRPTTKGMVLQQATGPATAVAISALPLFDLRCFTAGRPSSDRVGFLCFWLTLQTSSSNTS
jgi:hypothetical protein